MWMDERQDKDEHEDGMRMKMKIGCGWMKDRMRMNMKMG